ncbi:AAA family ATPase [Salinibacter altiplanensis]|uniref:AAA family ATPase n=1 Tax=Salinibacter altiplanensis TaxID=1803181 RepID=UPI000C9F3BEE|nr:AAA family ATPase [Salinibacter altiplanensis]
MLKKLIYIKNVARFQHERCDFDLKDFNLVFGENGCGKTTVSAIMHSVAKNDPGYITERKTVDSSSDPEAKILNGDGKVLEFTNGSWVGPVDSADVEVLDSHFVNENIYSGHTLSHDHKKRLHRFVIGERGQKLSDRIDRLDTVSRRLSRHIANIETKIEGEITSHDLSVDDFLALEEADDIDAQVQQVEQDVESQKKATKIRKQKGLRIPSLPEVPFEDIRELLRRTLDDVAEDAESRVTDHISRCMDPNGEKWVQRGLSYVKEEECPFCGRDLSEVGLIDAYRSYFSDEYEALKSSVARMHDQVVSSLLTQDGWRKVTSRLDNNRTQYDHWEERIEVNYQIPDGLEEEIEKTWTQLRNGLSKLLERKKSTPLEPVEIDEKTETVWEEYESLGNRLSQYEDTVREVNEEIGAFKSELEEGSLEEARARLGQLKDRRSRYSDRGKSLVKRLVQNRERKVQVLEEKGQVKEDLDDYQTDVLSSCQEEINTFLRQAGATFRIREAEVGYQGGTANARFSLEVNEQTIGIGNAVTEVGEQSFRNLLSEGDKATLAFAFFYARMNEIDDLSDRVIVIDDPISSLDEHRRNATRNAILDLADRARQTIVFSHSPRFLASLLGEYDQDSDSRLLQTRKTGDKTSELTSWSEDELERKIENPYFKHFRSLVTFVNKREGDPSSVANSLRHVLEGNLRRRFPDEYAKKDGSVGAFIGLVEDADDDNPLAGLQGTDYFEELKTISNSDYCHNPHHDDSPFLPEPINETELATWANRTVRFARALPNDY